MNDGRKIEYINKKMEDLIKTLPATSSPPTPYISSPLPPAPSSS